MKRNAPPLQAIEAFIVAAHSKSFREAADHLALSASAFSRRIQALENFLAVPLFDRSKQVIELTEFGRRYRDLIEPAMETVLTASAAFRPSKRTGKLRVMTSQSFATGWLMRRLAKFFAGGGVDIHLTISRDLSRLRTGEIDLAIIGGSSDFSHLVMDRLIDLDGVAATAPILADGRSPPTTIEEFEHYPVLGVSIPADMWPNWLANAGHKAGVIPEPLFFDTLALMYEAAASGLGVSLAAPVVSDAYLCEGRLQPCANICVSMGAHYDLIYADHSVRRRADVIAFRRWLAIEVEQSKRAFRGWLAAGSTALSASHTALHRETAQRAARAVGVREIADSTHINA